MAYEKNEETKLGNKFNDLNYFVYINYFFYTHFIFTHHFVFFFTQYVKKNTNYI